MRDLKTGRFKRKFSNEIEKEICQAYLNGGMQKELADKFGCSPTTIKNIVVRHRIPLRTKSQSKILSTGIKVNIHAFDIIDSGSSYWLGALYADGCVTFAKGKPRLEFNISKRDKEWLEQFVKWIGWTGKVQEYVQTRGYLPGSEMVRVQINREQLGYRLIELGCVPRKSLILTEIPKIVPQKFVKDFIRGYFDGDGSIEKERGRISIVGTQPFLEDIGAKINLPYRIYSKGKTYQLFYNQLESRKFCQIIYKDAKYFLERKFLIAQKHYGLTV